MGIPCAMMWRSPPGRCPSPPELANNAAEPCPIRSREQRRSQHRPKDGPAWFAGTWMAMAFQMDLEIMTPMAMGCQMGSNSASPT